jgi:TonB family protein
MLSMRAMAFRSTLLIAVFISLPTLLLGQKTNPAPIDTTTPLYPEALIGSGLDGVAKIKFTVNEKGLVEDAEVVEATRPEFGEAALEALELWRFKPATVDGKPVSKKVAIPFQFTASFEEKMNAQIGREVYQEITADKLRPRDLDARPVVVKRVRATYPPQLNGSGVDERVTVEVTIGPDGLVYNPDIADVQQPAFLLPALVAASQSEFEPPLKDGKPVYCVFEMTVWVYEGENPPGLGETGRRPLPGGS